MKKGVLSERELLREFLLYKRAYLRRFQENLCLGAYKPVPYFSPDYGFVKEIHDICEEWADRFPNGFKRRMTK